MRCALRCERQAGCQPSRTQGCFVRCQPCCQHRCHAIRFVCCFACRQPFHRAHASLAMNKTDIPLEALNRFRAAASGCTPTAKSRASRLLTLKEDIAALRKRAISYRAISELLTQTGIPTSDTCVTNFCHRVLKEKLAHKSSAKRSASRQDNPPASPKTTLPTAPANTGKTIPVPADDASFTSRGPHIAKVELLNPDEKYD